MPSPPTASSEPGRSRRPRCSPPRPTRPPGAIGGVARWRSSSSSPWSSWPGSSGGSGWCASARATNLPDSISRARESESRCQPAGPPPVPRRRVESEPSEAYARIQSDRVAQVDFNERQLTLKLVYFGPPLSGKTTNLRALHEKVDALNRGRLMTLETRDDRTLFFDLLPIFFRSNGLSFRIKVYTVPGQPMHEATRRVVLQGADGIVFVAHSDRAHLDANRDSWVGLGRNLAELGLRIPIVVQ